MYKIVNTVRRSIVKIEKQIQELTRLNKEKRIYILDTRDNKTNNSCI